MYGFRRTSDTIRLGYASQARPSYRPGLRRNLPHKQNKKEPGGRPFYGPSRRHFHSRLDPTRGGPRIGNDHFSTPPVSHPPNKGREQSFNNLRESRAAGSGQGGRSSVGPSDENRMLRSALLSRTFDSQIFFGGSEGGNEALRRFQRPGAIEGDVDAAPPPPAGGGRVGRMAEGAAWTPGGRRLISGSTAFTSHLGSGMMAKTHENAEEDGGNGENLGVRFTARDSGTPEASAEREPPVWIPKLDPKSSRPVTAAVCGDGSGGSRWWHPSRQAGGGKLAPDRKRGVKICSSGCNTSGGVSLAKFMSSREKVYPGQGMDESHIDNGVNGSRERRVAVGHDRGSLPGERHVQGRTFERPAVSTIIRSGERGKFDWWGGASALDPGNESAREPRGWRTKGGRAFEDRPATVSDTYKSSLVFG